MYIVYKATHPDTRKFYYGYTSKSLKERIKEHTRNYGNCDTHTSVDSLSEYAKVTLTPPKDWEYEVIASDLTYKDANYTKYDLISKAMYSIDRGKCLNVRGACNYLAKYNWRD